MLEGYRVYQILVSSTTFSQSKVTEEKAAMRIVLWFGEWIDLRLLNTGNLPVTPEGAKVRCSTQQYQQKGESFCINLHPVLFWPQCETAPQSRFQEGSGVERQVSFKGDADAIYEWGLNHEQNSIFEAQASPSRLSTTITPIKYSQEMKNEK